MNNIMKIENLESKEKEKLCNLLECSEKELLEIDNLANLLNEKSDSMYEALLNILQNGCNIREATLIGILIGKMIGNTEAEKRIEEEIKDKLYNAFRGNKGLTL